MCLNWFKKKIPPIDTPLKGGYIIDVPKVSDYVLGVNSPITSSVKVFDWSQYLPDTERQSYGSIDYMCCTTMSGAHEIETQINYLIKSNQLPEEYLNYFNSAGYIQNGKFKLSVRFSAKQNKTDINKGGQFNVVAENFRVNGFLPDSDCPIVPNISWNDFYSPVINNITLATKAKKILQFLNIQYQYIPKVDTSHLLQAPVQIATGCCPGWDSGNIVSACSNAPICHATMVYGQDSVQNLLDFDHYPPFKQTLASNYPIGYVMQYIVTPKPLTLRYGLSGINVRALQSNLVKLGFANLIIDGIYGNGTQSAIVAFQKHYMLVADGIAGQMTLAKIQDLVSVPTSKIDLWCEAIKQMEGSNPTWNNPGDLEAHGQIGQIGIAKERFAIFDTYDNGYKALKSLLINACSGKSSSYKPDMTLYDFYNVYAPNSDGNNSKHYAEFVAQHLAVSANIQIKDLL